MQIFISVTPVPPRLNTSLTSGHPGVAWTLTVLTLKFWWPDMKRLVESMIRSCAICTTTKSPRCPNALSDPQQAMVANSGRPCHRSDGF